MVSIEDFKVLPFDKKCDYITTSADYLIYRIEAGEKYYLYYVDTYFVEVVYAPFEDKVLGIHAFSDITLLDPYLDIVKLTALSV